MAPTYVSAGGSAVVGDKVTYQAMGAVVNYPTSGQTTTVYVPITNPGTQTDKLTKVSVECKGTNAQATGLVVYFGTINAYSSPVTNGGTDFNLVPDQYHQAADANPYGIDVSIDVNFTANGGTFEIYSVTLEFGS